MRLVGQDDKKCAKCTDVRVPRLTGPGSTVAARTGLAVLAATALAVGCTGGEGVHGMHGAHGPQEPFKPPAARADRNGKMPDLIRRFPKKVTGEGYAVARLEDYL